MRRWKRCGKGILTEAGGGEPQGFPVKTFIPFYTRMLSLSSGECSAIFGSIFDPGADVTERTPEETDCLAGLRLPRPPARIPRPLGSLGRLRSTDREAGGREHAALCTRRLGQEQAGQKAREPRGAFTLACWRGQA